MKKKGYFIQLGALIVLGLILLFSFAGPLIYQADPNEVHLSAIRKAPGEIYPLGTDEVGRDILARLMAGGRVSLIVGLCATAVQLVFSLLAGTAAAMAGKKLSSVIMRIIDVMMCVPFYILAVSMAGLFGASIQNLILIIALFTWAPGARLVRAEVYRIIGEDFFLYAQFHGIGGGRLLCSHIIPNLRHLLIPRATLSMAQAIMMEATLSFLSLGVRAPHASWGSMLSSAMSITTVLSAGWMWMPAAGMIFCTVMSVNLLARKGEDQDHGRTPGERSQDLI